MDCYCNLFNCEHRSKMYNINLTELEQIHSEAELRQSRAVEALSGFSARIEGDQIRPDDLSKIYATLEEYGIVGAEARPSRSTPGAVVIGPAPAKVNPPRQARIAFGEKVHKLFTQLFLESPAGVGYCVGTNDKGTFDVGDPIGVTATGRIVNLKEWSKKHNPDAWPDYVAADELDRITQYMALAYLKTKPQSERQERLSDHEAAVLVHKALDDYQDETAVSRVAPGGFPELRRALKRAAKKVRSRDEAIKDLNDRAPKPSEVLTWEKAYSEIQKADALGYIPTNTSSYIAAGEFRTFLLNFLEYRKAWKQSEQAMSTLAQNLTVALQQGINTYKSGSPMWTAVQQGLNWRKTAQETATKTIERMTEELRNVLQGRPMGVNTYDNGTQAWKDLLAEVSSRIQGNAVERELAVCVSELYRTIRFERWAVTSDQTKGYRSAWYEALKAVRLHYDQHGSDRAKTARDEITSAVTKALEGNKV